MGGRGLDAEVQALLRALEESPGDWPGWLRLGQLQLRCGRPEEAERALGQARAHMPPLQTMQDGSVDLRAEWTALGEQLEQLERETALLLRQGRREALARALVSTGLSPELHGELIALEVQDGLPIHKETPRCPACQGPVVNAADGLRCARSGQGADVCRHTDAKGLHACPACGLVVRAWDPRTKGRLRDDPNEPPLGVPGKSRCPRCEGAVADWSRHFLRCPKGRPKDFPVCRVCGKRGQHARAIGCPRCRAEVVSAPCLESPQL